MLSMAISASSSRACALRPRLALPTRGRGLLLVVAAAEPRSGDRSAADLGRWEGKVAVVTGASSGIGRAVALRLAGAGMKVVGAARRADRLEELAAAIEEAGCGDFEAVPTDLADAQSVRGLFEAAREQWGGVDVLVNAGGVGFAAPLLEADPADWQQMVDVNIVGLSVATKEAVEDMHAREGEGHIFHISSMSGHRVPGPGTYGFYAATKFAVRALTEGLRQELRLKKSPVRVTSISPGLVETEFSAVWSRVPEEEVEEYSKGRYNGYHVLQPGDVADAVEYALAAPQHVAVHDLLLRATDDTGI